MIDGLKLNVHEACDAWGIEREYALLVDAGLPKLASRCPGICFGELVELSAAAVALATHRVSGRDVIDALLWGHYVAASAYWATSDAKKSADSARRACRIQTSCHVGKEVLDRTTSAIATLWPATRGTLSMEWLAAHVLMFAKDIAARRQSLAEGARA